MNDIEPALQRARDTKALEFGKGAMERLPGMLRTLFPGKKVVTVADVNTFAAAGQRVCDILTAAGIPMAENFIFRDPELYAEWSYLEELEAYLDAWNYILNAIMSDEITEENMTSWLEYFDDAENYEYRIAEWYEEIRDC